MKRATRLKLQADAIGQYGVVERDILDSDARQRAEIRDLKARLAAVAELSKWLALEREGCVASDCESEFCVASRALDLKNKEWKR